MRAPTVMKEYINHRRKLRELFAPMRTCLTWVYTGDLGVMDSDGFIYFRGRRKRMIVSSGYNIYPAQIENLLDATSWYI